MKKDLSKTVLRFLPNLRTASVDAKRGYVWGKPVANSNILKTLSASSVPQSLRPTDLVAERWMVSDDLEFPSFVFGESGESCSFPELLKEHGPSLLGEKHLNAFGPYLKVMMKLLDTHDEPKRGSLSVQVHPKTGHPKRPAKPEMWKGHGKIYLGWNRDMTSALISEASSRGELESFLNPVSLHGECVRVPGGIVHAIRYGSFLSEWSEAPGQEDVNKGHLQDSTVAVYDRTDGKPARPGKEDLPGTLDVLTHAETFGKFSAVSGIPECFEKNPHFERWTLFHTPEVRVEEWRVFDVFSIPSLDRGFPAYVEEGEGEIWSAKEKMATLKKGEEFFVPFSLKEVVFKARSASFTIQTWQAPFPDAETRLFP